MDNSYPLLLVAEKESSKHNLNIPYLLASVENIPLRDNSIDLIIANRLPHDPNIPEKRFHEFSRILRPNGELLLITHHPNFYGIPFTTDEYLGKRREVTKHIIAGGEQSPCASTIYLYPLEQHFSFLLNAGLTITGIYEPQPVTPWEKFTPIFLAVTATLKG